MNGKVALHSLFESMLRHARPSAHPTREPSTCLSSHPRPSAYPPTCLHTTPSLLSLAGEFYPAVAFYTHGQRVSLVRSGFCCPGISNHSSNPLPYVIANAWGDWFVRVVLLFGPSRRFYASRCSPFFLPPFLPSFRMDVGVLLNAVCCSICCAASSGVW